jgi:hypothetical protein
MKKIVVFLSVMAMVFGVASMASADDVMLNHSWRPNYPESGVNFDMTSRSHSWKFVLADWFPDYVFGWKTVRAGLGVHILEGYTPGKLEVSIEGGKYESGPLEIRANSESYDNPPAPAYIFGNTDFEYTDVVHEGFNEDGVLDVTVTILQNEDGTWGAFAVPDCGLRVWVEQTITIGSCDTGVFDKGHWISDAFNNCALDANNNFQYLRCVSDLIEVLTNENIITDSERISILKCAIQSFMSNDNK